MIHNLLIVFVLVVGCVVASPTCSDEEGDKCTGGEMPAWTFKDWPATQNELDEICLKAIPQLNCEIDFAERCPKSLTSLLLEPMKQFKQNFNKLCDKSSNLRKEYLKRISCINHKMSAVSDMCADNTVVTNPSFKCSDKVSKMEKCLYDGMSDFCSKPHAEVFLTVLKPYKAIYLVHCEYNMS